MREVRGCDAEGKDHCEQYVDGSVSSATSSDRPRVSSLPSTSGAPAPQANVAGTDGVVGGGLWWSTLLAVGVVGLCL